MSVESDHKLYQVPDGENDKVPDEDMEWTTDEEGDRKQPEKVKPKTKKEEKAEKKAIEKANKLHIRNSSILDATLIVMLMKELKSYEKSSKPLPSEKDLKKHLFGKKP